jgi:septal ring factor EnvC (AmiA/AmiB activator)
VAERDHEIAKAGLEARIDDMGRASEREKRAMEREISRLKGMSKQDAEHIDELQAELKAREREAAKTRGDLLQAKKEIQTMSLRSVPHVQTVESAEGLLKLQEEHKVALDTIIVNPPRPH